MRGKRIVVAAAVAAFGLALYGALPARSASAANAYAQSGAAGATDLSAQRAPRVRRVRPQIEIRRARKLVRECVSWLEQEARPSGTVIVPKMRCWWRAG
jgi:hypothetical protein